jgi:hypothetical protein
MRRDDFLDELHVRILRVTEDLRVIQRELNCAAMEAASDPELMEALNEVPEVESLHVLKSALDQMRHFIWFYMQVMAGDSADGEQLQEGLHQKLSGDSVVSPRAAVAEKFKLAADAALVRYFTDAKARKPN